ncbi:MAG: FapA family protein [Candidatus Hydrogenedentota bacterium]
MIETKPETAEKVLPPVVTVTLSPDGMQAWVKIVPAGGGTRRSVLTKDMILDPLRTQGITSGLKHDVIEELLAQPVVDENVLVAEGRPMVAGIDGTIEYMFDIDPRAKLRAKEETDLVDFKELNLIQNVKDGDLLAVRIPSKEGTPGITVRNERRPPPPARDRKLLAGKNVRISEDGNEARATASGEAYLMGATITVSQVHFVPGSVDAGTGNITFNGTVEVAGAVEDGFTVKATNDIIVRGSVGRATLEAGRNITVHGGMAGGNEGRITCGGDLRAKFIQEADITAVGHVIVYDIVMHSHIKCGGSVQVGMAGTKKGTIVGGQIRAFKNVFCKVLGSPMSTKTIVDVGVKPALLARMEELQADIVRDRQNFENIRKGLFSLEQLKEKLGGQLPPEKTRVLESLQLGFESLKTRLQDNATEFKRLQEEVSVKPRSIVSVYDDLYPGVKISIGPGVYYATKSEKYLTLKLESGDISTHTYTALGMPEQADPGEES